MGKLNAPRDCSYEFRVVEMDGIVWLTDISEHTHYCSPQSIIYAEPLYWMDGECDEVLPDGDYFAERTIMDATFVPLRETWGKDVSKKEAWDEARDSAHANHLM